MKKKIWRIWAIILVVGITFSSVPCVSYAKTTQDKLSDAQKEAEEAKDKVNDQKKEVDKLNDRKSALKKELKKLNSQLDTICERLEDLENQIIAKEDEIAKTQAALEEARETEATQYAAMKKRIQSMYKDSKNLYLEIMFQAKSFSDLITLNNYMESLADYDNKKFDEYQTTRKTIEALEAKLQSEKKELDALKAEAEEEKANVLTIINETQEKVAEYSDLIDEAEAELLAYEEELKKREDDVAQLKKQLEEEMRLSALAAKSVWRDISQVKFDDGDRYLLAVIIYCEAGGEPYEGKLAVGAVVINRVLSSVYPSTVNAVIRQNKQFSPVGSGRFDYYLAIGKTNNDCYRAADEAMKGMTNVGTCLHFRTPIPGLTGIQIGNHIFY